MNAGDEVLGWRAAIICGLLWGVAVAIVSTITQHVFSLSTSEFARVASGLLTQWVLVGIVLALGARICRGSAFAAKVVLLNLATFAVGIGFEWIRSQSTRTGDNVDNPAFGRVPVADIAVYIAWLSLFYGNIYLAGYFAMRRSFLIRRRLTTYRVARSQADALFRERRVSAHRGQLQPDLLLTALSKLRARYGVDAAAGDELFDCLVTFLRSAIPSVRSGLSTLASEWETIRSYAALRDMLGTTGGACTLRREIDPIPALPFPSLVLLPALDEIGAALPGGEMLTLILSSAPAAVRLTLAASVPVRLSSALDQRIRTVIAMIFGSAASLSNGPDLPFTIELPNHLKDRTWSNDSGGDDDAQDTFSGIDGVPPGNPLQRC